MKLYYVDFEKALQGRPSNAVKAMLEALDRVIHNHRRYKYFKLAMFTFGDMDENHNGDTICLGCAANAVLSEMFKINFKEPLKKGETYHSFSNLVLYGSRSKYKGYTAKEYAQLVWKFERAIDALRLGTIGRFIQELGNESDGEGFGIPDKLIDHLLYSKELMNSYLNEMNDQTEVSDNIHSYWKMYNIMVKLENAYYHESVD